MARRYDEAIATAASYLKTEPKSWYVRKILSVCYALNDRCSEAISETEKILAGVPSVESDADTLYQMAFNYAHCGEIGKAKALLEAFNKTSVASEDPAGVAWIYAALGEKELALSALEKGVAARSPLMPYLKVDPILDSLRDDPRFNELLRKIGFEK